MYRGDFALGNVDAIPADYHSDLLVVRGLSMRLDLPRETSRLTIGGFRFRDMVAYYLADDDRASFFEHARTGFRDCSSKYVMAKSSGILIQPIDLIAFHIADPRVAHKLAYYAIAIAPFALGVLSLRVIISSDGWPGAFHVFAAFCGIAR